MFATNERGFHALGVHCLEGNFEVVVTMLQFDRTRPLWEKGCGPLQRTPLAIAAAAGHADIIQLLLEHGVDINMGSIVGQWSPLTEAAKYGQVECVKLLLQAGADPFRLETAQLLTPVHVLARGPLSNFSVLASNPSSLAECMRLMLQGNSTKVDTPIKKMSPQEVSSRLHQSSELFECVNSRDGNDNEVGQAIVELLALHIGCTPFQIAVAEQQPELVAELLKAGADPNRAYHTAIDTPLILTLTEARHPAKLVKTMLDYGRGLDVNKPASFPPIHVSGIAMNQRLPCCRIFISIFIAFSLQFIGSMMKMTRQSWRKCWNAFVCWRPALPWTSIMREKW